jgi:hypothetical protein
MTEAAVTETNIEDGPAMKALANDKQRAFVRGLFEAPKKDGAVIWAARVAGYGTDTSTNKVLSTIGARLHTSEPIQRAIAEYSQRMLRGLSPTAIKSLENLLGNPEHKDHARGIAMVLDRSDPIETTHNLVVNHRSEQQLVAATKEVIERIHALAKRVGLPQLAPPLDADFSVVSEGGTS